MDSTGHWKDAGARFKCASRLSNNKMGVSFGGRKSKGSVAERDLIHKFWGEGWGAVRVAGSGSSQFPSPDLLVGNKLRKLALEVKAINADRKYFPKEEIEALQYFSEKYGAEPWVAIKFDRDQFYFVNPEDLKETKKSFVATVDLCKSKGLLLQEIIKSDFL